MSCQERQIFSSTVIPTVGRPTLSRAVTSVLNQTFAADNLEIIVVNDSGQPLPEADWQRSERVQIINTNRHNRSVARNTGAAVARGMYLHFLDDDDWMLPGAFESLWELAHNHQAAWLCGAFRLVNNERRTIAEIYPDEVGNCYIQVISWEWHPLQASFIESTAFFAVGGFASLHSLLGGFEDTDLSRKVARYYDIACTSQVVTVIRAGDEGSTTNYADMFKQNRQSREKALNTLGAFSRLKASAKSSPSRSSYWYGRILYYYLASLKWNVDHNNIFTAFSRMAHMMATFGAASQHILSADFWRGASRPHVPRARIGTEESGANLYANTRW